MTTNPLPALIIGGGISGMSCGRRLHDAGVDFLLVTKEVGGRLKASKSFDVDFGAAYMTEDYKNVMHYVDKGERMKIRDFHFYYKGRFSTLFSLKNFRYYYKTLKLLFLTWRIRNHIQRFRKKAPHLSMKEGFEQDPFLLKYWLMPAKTFIKRYKLKEVDQYFVDSITASTAFVHSDRVNAIYLISMLLPGILKSWTADFTHTEERLTKGWKKKIKKGTVLKVKKNKRGTYDVHTSIGDFMAKNVVFAAPQQSLKDVYPLPSKNIQQEVYVFNIKGERKQIFKNRVAVIFQPDDHDIHMIWRQRDGSDIIYTLYADPDFSHYYDKYKIVEKVHWEPAMTVPTCCLIDQDLGEGLYLASDYNVSGMEDSFLSGLYAANQIIEHPEGKPSKAKPKGKPSDLTEKDPVCRMRVDPKISPSIKHGKKTYYFCGETCAQAFKNDPESYTTS